MVACPISTALVNKGRNSYIPGAHWQSIQQKPAKGSSQKIMMERNQERYSMTPHLYDPAPTYTNTLNTKEESSKYDQNILYT